MHLFVNIKYYLRRSNDQYKNNWDFFELFDEFFGNIFDYYTMHNLPATLPTIIKVRQWSRRIKRVIFRIKRQPKQIRYATAASAGELKDRRRVISSG